MARVSVLLILGARPQFIKSAPLIKELLAHKSKFNLTIVHSGQHYDQEMSSIFFSELKLPKPELNLQVGSGTHGYQTATIMVRLEEFMKETRPDVVIVPGDTNTTLAGAIAAAKAGFKVAHMEAGLRSGDMSMPEEINRRLTDHCSTLLFAPTQNALKNLAKEGLGENARLTGDTMVDGLRDVMPIVKRREEHLLQAMHLTERNFILTTLHRPSNVDDPDRLREILRSLHDVAKKIAVVFPIHPRTRARIRALGVRMTGVNEKVHFVSPQGYIETLALLKNAECLLTDSGGMQKEAYLLHTPCVTLRSTTEWPETLKGGANRLITNPRLISASITAATSRSTHHRRFLNPFGDGTASPKVRRILEQVS
ncbi:MAG TPA: UDP-N-acetylglucosamine 2-epimerase (non-hydrolyzing) [Candidatus Acidoferrales bacterium]|nr:UDP-N-acetylglucosamine 2-epimerase (non-hydrolyzing) [Candidatus Acidoferrales bacterium]